jgi:hypothetical protein
MVMDKSKNKPTGYNFFWSLVAVIITTISFLALFALAISLFTRALLLDLSPTGRFTYIVFGIIIFRIAWFLGWVWRQFFTHAKTTYKQLRDSSKEERRIERLIEHHESETEISEQNVLQEKQDNSL